MDSMLRPLVRLALLLPLALAPASRAESLRLAPRHEAGDTYLLQLQQAIDTTATARGPNPLVAENKLRVRYEAAVVVLDVDEEGVSVRERHDLVSLDYEEPEGRRSLLPRGASYEVRRDRKGRLRIHADDARLDERVKRLVRGVLAEQLACSMLPAFLDPRRPVIEGEIWTLDTSGARSLLRSRGFRAIAFAEAPRAWMERDPEGALTLRYSIQADWIEPTRMPPDARAARSRGRLAGEIRLAADPRGHRHVSSLTVDLDGAVVKPGVVRAYPWRFASARETAERVQLVRPMIVSGVASPASRIPTVAWTGTVRGGIVAVPSTRRDDDESDRAVRDLLAAGDRSDVGDRNGGDRQDR